MMESRGGRQVYSFLALVERKRTSRSQRTHGRWNSAFRRSSFTLDVSTGITFGEPFGFSEKDGDVEKYIETTETMLPMFGILGALPWLVYAMYSWPISYPIPGGSDKIGLGRLMKYVCYYPSHFL